jgi:hypothetical protein
MPTKKSAPVSEWQTSWFRFKLADGRVVVAPAHGAGGLFRGAHGEKQIRRAIRAAEAGEPTGYYEPKPGHMLVWPQYSFADNGPEMTIPLAGATVRLVKATRARTRAHKAGKAALGPEDWAAKPVHHATRKRSPAQLDREIAEVLAEPGRPSSTSEMERFNDLNRQGFMRNVYATPKRSRAPKPLPPTISCDACMNWHPQGRHTATAAQRKINLVKMRELRDGGGPHSTIKKPTRLSKTPQSHATKKSPSTGGAHQKWNVYSGGKLIDSVFYVPNADADYVRRGLINHDGYPSDIRVRRAH